MKKIIKIGVLGCSNISQKALLPAICNHPNFQLAGIASRSTDKALKFSKLFKTLPYSYDELINDDDIDAIYVSLPVGLHYLWGKKVLQSGKHLLMEKTFTVSFKEAEELVSLALHNNIVAMEALMYTYHSLYQKVRESILDGTIGKIRSIQASFGFPSLPQDNIRSQKTIGGGATLDNLIYPLSLCLNLANEKLEDYNYKIYKDDNSEVDTRGSLQLHFTSFSAHLTYGFGYTYRNDYIIWGSDGYLKVNRGFSRPVNLDAEILVVKQNNEKIIKVKQDNHFYNMIDAFYQKVIGQDIIYMNEKENILQRMEIISELYQSLDVNS
ncbi:Gfo/Idh/MocA family protein [Chengkuizengella sediminis]|uniref:Gfo/Idh/MocA family protein n=1 Tax=Chengkuizengella sediminis TaxID=1885917 RepID=UPI00138A4610|nr:Gfo/Idh/MocA family oxidoreductase [Chengkuizengella sediminis]NDI36219.1 Gfo/Idh/MocA family oxidoreductase [Chengkuizengella sediminis]